MQQKIKNVAEVAGPRIAVMDKLVLVFVGIASVAVLAFAVLTPLFWGQDEEAHFARAYQISKGTMTSMNLDDGQVTRFGYGGTLPVNARDAIIYRVADIVDDQGVETDRRKADASVRYERLGQQELNGQEEVKVSFSNTAVYSPIVYALPALSLKLSSLLSLSLNESLIFARVICGAIYIACVAVSIQLLARSRIKWVVFVAALFPTVIFQASIVSTDGLINGLSIVVISLVAKGLLLEKKLQMWECILLLLAALVLPLTKINYLFLSLLILAIPLKYLAHRSLQFVRYGIVFVAIALAVAWNRYVTPIAETLHTIIGVPEGVFSVSEQLHWVLFHPFATMAALLRTVYLQQGDMAVYIFGQLSAAMITVPAISFVLYSLALPLAGLYAANELVSLKSLRKWNLMYVAVVLMGMGISIFMTLYLTFTEVGGPLIAGVQGRYFIPLILPFLLLLCVIAGRLHLTLPERSASSRLGQLIVGITAVGLGLGIVEYAAVLY